MSGAWTAVAVGGASIAGNVIGANAAGDAADTAAGASRYAADLGDQQYTQTRDDLQPYREVATGTLSTYEDLIKRRQAIVDAYRTQESGQLAAAGLGDLTDEQIIERLSTGDLGAQSTNDRWAGRMLELQEMNREIDALGDPALLTRGALNELDTYGRSRVDQGMIKSNIPIYDNNFDITKDPSYLFRKSEQDSAINANMGAAGKVVSGNRLNEIMTRSGELASQEYRAADARNVRDYGIDQGNEASTYGRSVDAYGRAYGEEADYLNRRANLANVGQTATTANANFGAANAANAGNAAIAAGNATAAGQIGAASAIQGGIGDLTSLYTNYRQPSITTDYNPTSSPYMPGWTG